MVRVVMALSVDPSGSLWAPKTTVVGSSSTSLLEPLQPLFLVLSLNDADSRHTLFTVYLFLLSSILSLLTGYGVMRASCTVKSTTMLEVVLCTVSTTPGRKVALSLIYHFKLKIST
jgi:hypothetical protein